MSHARTVKSEFSRQAERLLASSTLGARELTERVGEALGSGLGRVLDLACGPGLLVPVLAHRTRTIVGLDLTPRTLALARQAHPEAPLHLVQGLAEGLPFAPASFDAVVLRLALHHFPDPSAVLAGVRRIVPVGGRLVVLDLLAPEDSRVAALRDAIERLRDPSHTRLLPRSDLRDRVVRAGFELTREERWSQARDFAEWAAIVNEPRRMRDLEIVLRELARSGADSGMDLREEQGGLRFTYEWVLLAGRAR